MDLIQDYDEESTSSDDDTKYNIEENVAMSSADLGAQPSTSSLPSNVSGFDTLGNVPIDRLMIVKAKLAAEKTLNQRNQYAPGFSAWCADTDKEIRMFLG